MRGLIVITIHLAAALAPLIGAIETPAATRDTFPGWPGEWAGKELTALPMSDKEKGFGSGFPGRIGRFSDGGREIILRYVERPSRLLHPSADCLRGSGFEVSPQPARRDENGRLWGCVMAQGNGDRYRVCEHIYDANGGSWYDVSSWFWTVLWRGEKGPWWAVTVAEKL
jgi:hypothetical protein